MMAQFPVIYQVTDGQDTVTSTLVISITPVDEEVSLDGLTQEGERCWSVMPTCGRFGTQRCRVNSKWGVYLQCSDGVQSLTLAGVTLITNGQLGASFPQSIISPLGNVLTISAVTYNPRLVQTSQLQPYPLATMKPHKTCQ